MAAWIPGDAVNCFYLALVVLGLIYTIISLLGADFDTDVDIPGPDIDFHIGPFEFGGIEVPDVDFDVDAPDVDVGGAFQFPSISSFTISSFVTGFGAAGMIANMAFNVTAVISLIWAFVGGILVGGVMQLFYGGVLLKSQGSSEVRISDLAGMVAEVTVPIAEGGKGQIAFISQGRRVTFSARAADNLSIARGSQVKILRIVGSTAVVRPFDEE
ncbi:MAG: NfeD family protein [Anaerolineales bacterium]|nr:NfeD family protein [Anaerolineales bacterium]